MYDLNWFKYCFQVAINLKKSSLAPELESYSSKLDVNSFLTLVVSSEIGQS